MILRRLVGDSPFAKNVFTLASGTAIAQAIPLAISPLLTRLYTPEDFGTFSVYFGFLMIASVFATGKFELAIVLPPDPKEAKTVLDLSIFVAIVTSSLLLLCILIGGRFVLETFNAQQLGWNLLWLPLGILGVGTSQGFYYYLNREKNFRGMTFIRIARSVAYSALALAGANVEWLIGLVMADATSYLLSAFIGARQAKFRVGHFSGWVSLKSAAVKYSNFPKYLLASGLLEKGSGQAPVFLLTTLFGSIASAGFFSFAQRMIVVPADLVSRAIGDVFRQQASEEYTRKGECRDIFRKTMLRLLAIGILPFILAYFIVEDAFGFVFGEEWRTAGNYARIMMPMFFLQFIVSPLSVMFVIAAKQKYDLFMQTALAFLVIAVFLICYSSGQHPELAILGISFTYCVKYFIEGVLSYKFANKPRA